jgi:serine protease Do
MNRLSRRNWFIVLLMIAALWTASAQSVLAHSAVVNPVEQGFSTGRGAEEPGEVVSGEQVESLEDAQKAVVQIEAVGTFMDPEEGLVANAAGSGSGFIIDETGIAVTNNHVVTGGGLFRVYVDGHDEPLNARVLGVSECADLAVIDIEGNGFPYLQWHEGRVNVGLDVYAAGFPLGDPEYTMTRGIISKSRAKGDSSWASLDYVLEHDATLNPGNSGGPLLDEDGSVVGVNYRRNEAGQFFAIAGDVAIPIVEQLRAGENVNSIGINGEAVVIGDELTGIWVASVESGSPAEVAGIEPGDILLTIEGVTLAEDGTMATYCEILSSHSADDVMAVEVLRLETEEVLEGQLNGRPLEQSFSIAEEIEESAAGESATEAPAGEAYTEYTTIADEQGILSVETPVEWADVEERLWVIDDNEVGIALFASPDLEAFEESWGTPGVVLRYSEDLVGEVDADALLDSLDYSGEGGCIYEGRETLSEGFFVGAFDTWSDCGEAGSSALIVALIPESEAYVARLEVYAVTEADFDALERILDTFLIQTPGEEEEEIVEEDIAPVYDTVEDIDTDGLTYEYALIAEPAISALVPVDWDDGEGGEWLPDGEYLGEQYAASTDLESYNATFDTAGFSAYMLPDVDEDFGTVEALDAADMSEECEYVDRGQHSHTIYGITYEGAYDIWSDCGGVGNTFIVLVAASQPVDHAMILQFVAIDDADLEAFDILARSFYVETEATADLIENASQEEGGEDDALVLVDEESMFRVVVPPTWTDWTNDDWELDGDVVGRMVTAAPDVDAFNDRWDTPGVFLAVSETLGEGFTSEELLDFFDFSDDCTYDDRYEYSNQSLEGVYDTWLDCGDIEGGTFIVMAAAPVDDEDLAVILYINMPSEDDVPAFDQLLSTLVVASGNEEALTEEPDDLDAGDSPTATVVVRALNVRNGPGTGYQKVGAVADGDELEVIGQVDNCSWLYVVGPDGQEGWVSGNEAYVSINTDCAEIPEVPAPEEPSASAAPAAQTGPSSSATASSGCYVFQNNLGAELTITFTNAAGNWNDTFRVGPDEEVERCFEPGAYTYTLDAPPPWGSTNGNLDVAAGDYYLFPIDPAD